MDDNLTDISDNVTELTYYIESLFEKGEKIDGRKKKERNEWRVIINQAINKLNKIREFKVYKIC